MMNTAGNYAGSFLYQMTNNTEHVNNQYDMHGLECAHCVLRRSRKIHSASQAVYGLLVPKNRTG